MSAPVTPPPLGVSAEQEAIDHLFNVSANYGCMGGFEREELEAQWFKVKKAKRALLGLFKQSAQPSPTARERALEEALKGVLETNGLRGVHPNRIKAIQAARALLTTPSKPAGGSGLEETKCTT